MMKKSQPKPPVKKYTAQDSVNYRGMQKRQDSDFDALFKNFPRNSPVEDKIRDRMDRRTDSMSNSPYFKSKAKVSVKNGVTSRTLVENIKKAKSTKPAPSKPMVKVVSNKTASSKKPMMKTTKK
jgi:hypothetical protein